VCTAGSARCSKLTFNGYGKTQVKEKDWILLYQRMLRKDNSKMCLVLDKTSPFKLPGRRTLSIALVVSGSEGDRVPMQAFHDVLKDVSNLTVFTSGDLLLRSKETTKIYTKTYKPLVSGYRGTVKPFSVITDMINNITGTFDYVIAMHFAKEAFLLKSTVQHIVVYPVFTKLPMMFDIVTSMIKTLLHKPPVVRYVHSVWSQIDTSAITTECNVGLPLTEQSLHTGVNEERIAQIALSSSIKFHLITFGSMTGDLVDNLIIKLVNVSELPVIFVRGYSTTEYKFSRQGRSYKGTHEIFSNNLIVVNHINHHAIAKYVEKVSCHGGAGTIQTFMCNKVPIRIYPQAYDQAENAAWYRKQPIYEAINYTTELNNFR
jgi:hypothetical protein